SLILQSSVKPTFIVTCQCATLPPSISPRVSVTWNQRRLCSVFAALATALAIACSRPFGDEPVSSMVLYTWFMAFPLIKRFAGKARAGNQRLELCPHDRRMHAAVERPLREAAVRPRHQVLAADEARDAREALCDQLRMLDDVGGVADDAGYQLFPRRQLHALPYAPFVLGARVRALDEIGAGIDLQDQVDDILQRHIAGMRAGPAAPAHVIAHALRRDAGERLVQHLDVHLDPAPVIGEARRRHHAVV